MVRPQVPSRWDYETDVVVVGGGNAGLPAAISAHNAGAEVVLVEENVFLGGLMRGSGGFMFFCDTHVQARNGIEDRIKWGIEDEMLMSEYRAIPEMVRTYVEGGAETCRWLEGLGLTFSDKLLDGEPPKEGEGGRGRIARTHYAAVSPTGKYPGGAPLGQSGFALTSMFENAIKECDIPVLLEHRMTLIHRAGEGRVVGIRATKRDGQEVDIRARRAVVLASGGATTNEQLIRAWDPRMVDEAIFSDGLPYMRAMGDALTLGQDVGAGLSDMSFVCFTPVRFGSRVFSISMEAIAGASGVKRTTGVQILPRLDGFQRVILVKNDGTRYLDESLATYRHPRLIRDTVGVPAAEYPEEPFIHAFLRLPSPKNVWAIVDADSAEAMGWELDQMVSPNPLRGRALHPESVAVADTLEELAGKIGMDFEALANTVSRYNGFVENGEDLDFGKRAPLYPLRNAPYYAARMHIIRHTPAGGLRINTRGQVLDRAQQHDGEVSVALDDEAVIPGLYAAGECSAFVGFRRSHRKTGPIVTMGRIAGLNAAADGPSDGIFMPLTRLPGRLESDRGTASAF